MVSIDLLVNTGWGPVKGKNHNNDGYTWPTLLSPTVKILDMPQALSCHPELIEPYSAWLSIRRRRNFLPQSSLSILQRTNPVPVVERQVGKGEKAHQFIGGFNWASDTRLSSLAVVKLNKNLYSDLDRKSPLLRFLVKCAWLEVVGLIRLDLDMNEGLIQWQQVLNEQMPQAILKEVFGVSSVTTRMMAEMLGISEAKIYRLRAAPKKQVNQGRPKLKSLEGECGS